MALALWLVPSVRGLEPDLGFPGPRQCCGPGIWHLPQGGVLPPRSPPLRCWEMRPTCVGRQWRQGSFSKVGLLGLEGRGVSPRVCGNREHATIGGLCFPVAANREAAASPRCQLCLLSVSSMVPPGLERQTASFCAKTQDGLFPSPSPREAEFHLCVDCFSLTWPFRLAHLLWPSQSCTRRPFPDEKGGSLVTSLQLPPQRRKCSLFCHVLQNDVKRFEFPPLRTE